MTLAENRQVQLQANRRQAYTQLMGQKTELLMLLQQWADAYDKQTFYEGRAEQFAATVKSTRPAPLKALADSRTFEEHATQQERNAAHYSDEIVVSAQKIFESIALVQLSFPADAILDNRITAVEEAMFSTVGLPKEESLRDRTPGVPSTEDAEQQLSKRQKRRMVYIQQAIVPITGLLVYMRAELIKES